MNRMQKLAWFSFFITSVLSLLTPAALVTGFLLPAYKSVLCIISFAVFVILLVGLVWIHRSAQSPAEPFCDERDSLINRWAVMIAFGVFGLLIYISDALLISWESIKGNVPMSFLPVIHLEIGIITVASYYAVMLVLYYKKNKTTEAGAA